MLQRAATNSYPWWWASHIRTKQSKWLEQNLQDMEGKVGSVLELIEEDGDSFRKRAEMYYKKRPELINFVEETYRAYRALAERYDHISKELHNANHTIATVFPGKFQFGMEDDDGDASPGFQRRHPESFKIDISKFPKLLVADLKGLVAASTKKFQPKKLSHSAVGSQVATSGLSKQEGLEEIEKFQRRILALQTEKEFAKNTYESGLAEYWDMEKEIEELQEKVSSLQDEFGAGSVIEDDEARNLMAATVLKSCQEALGQLQEKQEKSAEETKRESKRIDDARKRLDSLKDELLPKEVDQEKPSSEAVPLRTEELKVLDQEAVSAAQPRKDLESSTTKIKEQFVVEFSESLTVSQMAEKIDELVSKVVCLETVISSQTALIQRMKTETNDLQAQIQTLEDDKATLLYGKNDLSNKLRKMEEKWSELQDLNKSAEEQNCNLQTYFTEAHCNLEHLSKKLLSVQPNEEPEAAGKSLVDNSSRADTDPTDGLKKLKSMKPDKKHEAMGLPLKEKSPVKVGQAQEQEHTPHLVGGSTMVKDVGIDSNEDLNKNDPLITTTNHTDGSLEQQEITDNHASSHTVDSLSKVASKESRVREQNKVSLERQGMTNKHASPAMMDKVPHVRPQEPAAALADEPDWRHLFLSGMDNKEKILPSEYTVVLRNYQEMKKMLAELETKNKTNLLEVAGQLKDLKNDNSTKEEEILCLRQKLKRFQEEISQSGQCNCHHASNLTDRQSAESTVTCEQPNMTTTTKMQSTENEEIEEDRAIPFVQRQNISPMEEKFRMSVDKLLEENLDFWLRFSTSFSHIQKFDTEVKDLQAEVSKLEERHKQEGIIQPVYKHLREVQTEIAVWLEKSVLLKEELNSSSASLCDMQEKITKALKRSAEDDEFTFTSHQTAKFQGEILNMKQENNKVAEELRTGLDHVTALQLQVARALVKITEEFRLPRSKSSAQLQQAETRPMIPLRSFLSDTREKKHKSIFSFVHPAWYRQRHPLR